MIWPIITALLSCSISLAQTPSATAAPLAFEVASIRPHQGPLHVMMGFSSSGSRLTLEGYSGLQLILEAYDLKGYQLSSAPLATLADDVYYDIVAKAEGIPAPSRSQFRQMLQRLLAQRFNLKFHLETREVPVYALTVGKNGPKFKKSTPGASEKGLFGVHGRNQTIATPGESMEALVDHIRGSFISDRPIVNRTGLTGTYDVKLEATPEWRLEGNPQAEDISVFTAVQEQLGLKLEPSKASVQIFVIDHIEQHPSDN